LHPGNHSKRYIIWSNVKSAPRKEEVHIQTTFKTTFFLVFFGGGGGVDSKFIWNFRLEALTWTQSYIATKSNNKVPGLGYNDRHK
jgi:hypothetical protein